MMLRRTEERGKLTRKRQYHGLSKYKFYKTYLTMIARCTMPWRKDYKYYGGRGIKVCDTWLENAANFLNDMGDKPTQEYELDRINADDGYYKENCRWVHKKENKKRQRHFNVGKESVLGYVRIKKAMLCEKCLKHCKE